MGVYAVGVGEREGEGETGWVKAEQLFLKGREEGRREGGRDERHTLR